MLNPLTLVGTLKLAHFDLCCICERVGSRIPRHLPRAMPQLVQQGHHRCVNGLFCDTQGRLSRVASARPGSGISQQNGAVEPDGPCFPSRSRKVLNVEANLRKGQFPFERGGSRACAIIRVVSAPKFFSPRPAVKSALLLFHTWGFVSLAVQSASRTHFSRGVPPNCFLAVPARPKESDLRAGAARTLCVHAHTTCVLAGQVHPQKSSEVAGPGAKSVTAIPSDSGT